MLDYTLDPVYSIFPLLGSLISLVMTILMFKNYYITRKSYFGHWAFSFFFFTISTFIEGISPIFGWSELSYKIYYLSAIILVYFLGGGQLFLMINRKILFKPIFGKIYVIYGTGIILGAIFFAFITPINLQSIQGIIPGGNGWADNLTILGRVPIRLFSPLLTIPGSILVIGGSLLAYLNTRLIYNLLITLGSTLLATAGILASLFNITIVLFLGEVFGVGIIFIGVVISKKPTEKEIQ